MIKLYINRKDDHYSDKIREWLGKYGIEWEEVVINNITESERVTLQTELNGVKLKGPTVAGFSRIWSYLEVTRRPRVICEELIWLGANSDD